MSYGSWGGRVVRAEIPFRQFNQDRSLSPRSASRAPSRGTSALPFTKLFSLLTQPTRIHYTTTVKALRRLRRAPRAAEIQDVPIPAPGPDEILMKVSHCGVCGSDLHAFLNHRGYEGFPERFTFGHEFSGIIENTGPGVSRWKAGDRAVVISVQGCLEKSC